MSSDRLDDGNCPMSWQPALLVHLHLWPKWWCKAFSSSVCQSGRGVGSE